MDKATTVLHLLIEIGFRAGLWVFFLWLDQKMPYVRHIDEDELWYYRYPSMDSIIPKMYMYLLIICTPLFLLLIQYITKKEEKSTIPSIISTIFGLSLAYCIVGVFSASLKLTVGKPRPNFYLRCFPEGYGTDIDNCDGEYNGQMDGRKGFISAHACFLFCCMVYMCFHVYKIYELTRPRFLKGVIISGMFLMIFTATMVSVTRTMDYHHHCSDVIGGALLGSTVGYICQHLYSVRDEVLDSNLRKIMKVEN